MDSKDRIVSEQRMNWWESISCSQSVIWHTRSLGSERKERGLPIFVRAHKAEFDVSNFQRDKTTRGKIIPPVNVSHSSVEWCTWESSIERNCQWLLYLQRRMRETCRWSTQESSSTLYWMPFLCHSLPVDSGNVLRSDLSTSTATHPNSSTNMRRAISESNDLNSPTTVVRRARHWKRSEKWEERATSQKRNLCSYRLMNCSMRCK